MSLATHCIPWDEDCTICNPPPRQNPDDAHPTPDSQITQMNVITREDLDFLRGFVHSYEHEWRDGEWGYETKHLWAIVRKLELLFNQG